MTVQEACNIYKEVKLVAAGKVTATLHHDASVRLPKHSARGKTAIVIYSRIVKYFS